jgi:hypothetical protein
MLTPLLGELGRASIGRAVVAAAGPPGRVAVMDDPPLARALAQHGFYVLLLSSRALRPRPDYTIARATSGAVPLRPGSLDALVYSGKGADLRGAADDASTVAEAVQTWLGPLRAGGRLILLDRIDGGLLGARAAASREDLCAALLAARMHEIGQLSPRAGTVITFGAR